MKLTKAFIKKLQTNPTDILKDLSEDCRLDQAVLGGRRTASTAISF
jgi:hypothetical protein